LLFILAVFGFDRVQRRRIRSIERQKNYQKELAQAKEIEKAYTELKTTQAQLIHAEKMASLGELTAGIAHEIQNPLNFVNNFSEVNLELIGELKEGLDKGNLDEVKIIAEDISLNEQKINFHGRRADGIVKGMLQHSRTSTGQKEPMDINALADEYLRLSYHGLRAKDKSFNADFKTNFEENLPKVNVIPQDIGRVLLNLVNNAFYAVSNRNLSVLSSLTGLAYTMASETYKPTVMVSTRKKANGIEISVQDNGNGIPEEIKDKIFQPFFTTKPTGEGTGLGLSLSYDIVKAHGGELKVESKEGKGTEFIIVLPISA
jgi:signal transduction histidine kinase